MKENRVTEEDLLQQVMDKWHEAGKMKDEADEAEAHAQNLRMMSEDRLDEADTLAEPLIEAHPEWKDALLTQQDPRV